MSVHGLKNLSRVDVCLWLDFYGPLLTQHTQDILNLHFAEDMSLAEIAENLGISRQAVHDRIRRGLANLVGYEKKLKLVKDFKRQKLCIAKAIHLLEEGEVQNAQNCLMELKDLL
jgi:predicted DNA-binding protein YlxM (UPF0122 family)